MVLFFLLRKSFKRIQCSEWVYVSVSHEILLHAWLPTRFYGSKYNKYKLNTNWCCALTLQWSSTTMWFNLLLKCCLRPTNNGLISSNKVVLVSHQLILWCLSSSTMNRFWNSITNLSFLSLLALIYLLIIKVCSHEMVAVMETRFFTSVS